MTVLSSSFSTATVENDTESVWHRHLQKRDLLRSHTRARAPHMHYVVLVCYCNGEWLHTAPQQLTACSHTHSVQHSYSKSESEWNGMRIWRARMMLRIYYTQNLAIRERFRFLSFLSHETQARSFVRHAINQCNYEIDFTSLHTCTHTHGIYIYSIIWCVLGAMYACIFKTRKWKRRTKNSSMSRTDDARYIEYCLLCYHQEGKKPNTLSPWTEFTRRRSRCR